VFWNARRRGESADVFRQGHGDGGELTSAVELAAVGCHCQCAEIQRSHRVLGSTSGDSDDGDVDGRRHGVRASSRGG
jgi:hypothetical protein